jgi:hypothetical protein
MTAVVYAAHAENAVAAQGYLDGADEEVSEETTEATVPGVTVPEWASKFQDFWKIAYPIFDMLYKSGFVMLSQIMAQVVNWFIMGLFA